jgi:predicted porin
MQKKLLAIAVAGAFAAPALVAAQSTVQVYGRINVEYGFADQGTGNKHDVDILQAPGSSVGFKGEEKLGGGLSAWFQCESTADVRGTTDGAGGFCSRNSAVGFKGSFGNLFVGTWDTPFKRSTISPGSGDTGLFGSAFLLFGSSTTVSDSSTASTISLNRVTFKRRQRGSINYHSPNFNGFSVEGAFSSTEGATKLSTAAAQGKPRIWSIAAKYKNGPIDFGAGYEIHKNFGTGALGANTDDDKGWHIGAAYKLGGRFNIGGLYTKQEFQQAAAATYERKAWTLGIEANLAGPGAIEASYTEADKASGPAGTATPGSPYPAIPAAGLANNTGAKLWQIKYVHSFSKRTQVYGGYSKLENDSAAAYTLGGLATPTAGSDQDAFVIGVDHRF